MCAQTVSAHDDLGTGNVYGTATATTANPGVGSLSISLNSIGLSDLNNAIGGDFALGGALTTLDGRSNEHLFGSSGGNSALLTELVVTSVPYFGDLDGNETVDIIDFGLFADAYRSFEDDANYNLLADKEPDGVVFILDFGFFADNYGFGTLQAATVPEPTSAAIAMVVVASLGLMRRRS